MMGTCVKVFIALFAVCLDKAQALGPNFGINLRLHQTGLEYGAQQSVDKFYEDFRNRPISVFSGNSGRTSYRVWNILIAEMTKPSFTLEVKEGQGIAARITIDQLIVTGDVRVQYKKGWINVRKSGRFTLTATSGTVTTEIGVDKDTTGRPVTSILSCSSQFGSFKVKIHAKGVAGAIIKLLDGRISNYLKSHVEPMICEQIRKQNTEYLIPRLQRLKVTTKVQDPRLNLDYSLIRAPQFGANYIDTTFKADVSWKNKTTGTATDFGTWPTIPGTESRMITIYITDYIMNAMGVLLYNDRILSYNVTRDQVSSKIQPRLALRCPGEICAGTLLPEIARKYPDGWMEAGVRATSPPQMIYDNGLVLGRFSGVLEAYVRRPNGDKIRVATVDAGLTIPMTLHISNKMITAKLEAPRVNVQNVMALTEGLKNLLNLVATGFTDVELDKIGQKGIDLPINDGVTLVDPQIFVRSDVIVVVTDITYASQKHQ